MQQGTFADIAILTLIGLSTVIGVYRGLIREVLTLATWIFASYVGLIYGHDVGDKIKFSQSENINYWIGVGAIFIGIVVVGFLIKILICKAFKIKGSKPYDRIGGAIFGAMRGAVVVLLVLVAGSDILSDQVWYKQSPVVSKFKVFADIVLNNMPNDWKKHMHQEVKDLQKTIKEETPNPHKAIERLAPAELPTVAPAPAPAPVNPQPNINQVIESTPTDNPTTGTSN